MKIRNGFISNSSSSSFICVIAKVKNKDKIEKYLKDNDGKYYSYRTAICKGDELEVFYNNKVNDFEDYMYVKSKDYNPEELYLITSDTGNEGDSEFYTEDDWYPNYDIDFDFFSDFWHNLVDKAEENGIEIVENIYYAGRNG